VGTHLRISITGLGARNPLLEHKSQFQTREINVRRGEIGLHPSLAHRKKGSEIMTQETSGMNTEQLHQRE
jgi:hypothetical protein